METIFSPAVASALIIYGVLEIWPFIGQSKYTIGKKELPRKGNYKAGLPYLIAGIVWTVIA